MYVYIYIYQSIHKTKSGSPSPNLTLPGFNTATLKAQEDEGTSTIGADSLKPVKVVLQLNYSMQMEKDKKEKKDMVLS
jgi:hypothetical protein